MLERFGIKDRWELAIVGLSLGLVAVTPLGKEASEAWVLGTYRSILLGIIVVYAFSPARFALPTISRSFMAAVLVLVCSMYFSVLTTDGSRFEAFFAFWEKALFIAAFLALAHLSIARPLRSKQLVLGGVVFIDLCYLIGAMAAGQRPLIGPFFNPNYFASFLLVGLAICAGTALHNVSRNVRFMAALGAVFLYFGIIQTASRGATLAGLLMLALCAFRAARRGQFALRYLVLGAVVVAITTVAANPALVRKFLDRGTSDPFNYQRAQIWLGTLSMIGEQPLTGVGLRQYYYEAKRFTPPVEGGIARYRRWPNIAHSEYLQHTAEMGIPAAILFFGLIGYLMYLAASRTQQVEAEGSLFNEASLLTAVALATHAVVDNNWTVPVTAAGLVAAAQGNLLPYSHHPARRNTTPTLKAVFAVLAFTVWVEAAAAPAVGLHFNQRGQEELAAGDFDAAIRDHRLALAIIPENAALLDNLGLVYLSRFEKTGKPEDLDRAEALFVEAMTQNPRFDLPGSHLESTLIHRLTGDPQLDRAIHVRIAQAGRHVLRASPINPLARRNFAEALYNLGEREEAYQQLQIALEYEPNFVPALLTLANWYEFEGRQRESNEYRQRAIDIVTRFKDVETTDFIEDALLGRPTQAWAKK